MEKNDGKRNRSYERLLFGTAGVPLSASKRDSIEGIRFLKKLGLDAMEMEFVRGVKMKEEQAKEVGRVRLEEGKELTAHGPYYINLNSKDKEIIEKSIERIVRTAWIAHLYGAKSITFHAAYYLGMDKGKVYENVKNAIQRIIEELKRIGADDVWIRPELTGKPTQFGDIDELIKLSKEVEGVLPCIDFSHNFARTLGKFNSKEAFASFLEKMKNELGESSLSNMHCQISGIEYGPKGEKNHLNLRDSKLRIRELLLALKEFRCKGVVICESPNIEEDAIYIKELYNNIKQ